MSNPTVGEIVTKFMEDWFCEMDHYGLYNEERECSCLWHDLFCDLPLEMCLKCRAGYKHIGPDGDSVIKPERSKK